MNREELLARLSKIQDELLDIIDGLDDDLQASTIDWLQSINNIINGMTCELDDGL